VPGWKILISALRKASNRDKAWLMMKGELKALPLKNAKLLLKNNLRKKGELPKKKSKQPKEKNANFKSKS